MEKIFKIEGMSCGHCITAVQKKLSELELKNSEVKIGQAKVEFDENRVNETQIKNAIEKAGYIVQN